MKIQAETITLRDDRTLTMRSAEEKNAQSMLDYIKKTAEETHFPLSPIKLLTIY